MKDEAEKEESSLGNEFFESIQEVIKQTVVFLFLFNDKEAAKEVFSKQARAMGCELKNEDGTWKGTDVFLDYFFDAILSVKGEVVQDLARELFNENSDEEEDEEGQDEDDEIVRAIERYDEERRNTPNRNLVN